MIKLCLLVLAVILSGFSSSAQSERVQPNCRWGFEGPNGTGSINIYKYEGDKRGKIVAVNTDTADKIIEAMEALVASGMCNQQSDFTK